VIQKYTSHSFEQTQCIASEFAKTLLSGDIVILKGELGAGKTTFTAGIGKGLGVQERIISPSFTLVRILQIPSQSTKLIHADLYRINDTNAFWDEFETLGLDDEIEKNITVIEWGENVEDTLTGIREFIVHLSKGKESNIREITIEKK